MDERDCKLLSPDFISDPYPVYRQLLEQDPVHWSEAWGCWVLTRYADVASTLIDTRLSNWRLDSYINQLPEIIRREARPLIHHISKWMGFSDPPEHTRLRKLAMKAFTPQVVRGMRPRIQSTIDQLIDDFRPSGRADLIRQFAFPLPAAVIAMMGVPPEDRDLFKKWSGDVVAFLGTGRARSSSMKEAETSLMEMSHFVNALIAQRRSNPQNDLISAMIALEGDEDAFSGDEVLGMCTSLLVAVHETTTNLIGNGLLSLLGNPEQLKRLQRDGALIASAIEELLRYESPVPRNWRAATETIQIGGERIEKGQLILQMLGVANRDPEKFVDPDRLDIGRKPNPHIAFGYGIHFCLGAQLARMEAQMAIGTLVSRFPLLRLAGESVQWHDNIAFRGLKALHAEFG